MHWPSRYIIKKIIVAELIGYYLNFSVKIDFVRDIFKYHNLLIHINKLIFVRTNLASLLKFRSSHCGAVVCSGGADSIPGPGISICGNNEDFYYAAFLKRSQKIKKKI